MEARVAHFYGWGYEEIQALPIYVFWEYFKAIPVIEAQQDMRAVVVATYPDMKKEARKKVWKELGIRANDFSRDEGKKTITLDQIARRMAGKLNGGNFNDTD